MAPKNFSEVAKATLRADVMTEGGCPAAPMFSLPTLQRNALRKIFERANFTPEEVARLGHKRLHQAEGIGQKGLEVIVAWLANYGYELKASESAANGKSNEIPKRMKRSLESAVRILRINGYIVYRRRGATSGGGKTPA